MFAIVRQMNDAMDAGMDGVGDEEAAAGVY